MEYVVNYSCTIVLQVLEDDWGPFITMSLNTQCVKISSDFMHAQESS